MLCVHKAAGSLSWPQLFLWEHTAGRAACLSLHWLALCTSVQSVLDAIIVLELELRVIQCILMPSKPLLHTAQYVLLLVSIPKALGCMNVALHVPKQLV